MSDYDDYNGDTMYDMWVDYTYHKNTGELDDRYDGPGYIGCYAPRYSSKYHPQKSTSQLIAEYRCRIDSNKADIAALKDEIEQTGKSIENPAVPPKMKAKLQKMLDVNYPNRLARYSQNIEKDEARLTELLVTREKARNIWTIAVYIIAILLSLFIFWVIYW